MIPCEHELSCDDGWKEQNQVYIPYSYERGGTFYINNFKSIRTYKGRCPKCNFFGAIIKNGFRYLKKSPYKKQRYSCLKCNFKFTNSKYPRFKKPDFLIDKIVYEDFTGSLRKIKSKIIESCNIYISHSAILRIKNKFKNI